MKKSNLIVGTLYILAGILFLLTALFTDTRLESLLAGFAGAGIGPGIIMVCQYFYWSSPKNQERYQKRLEKEQIELHDELKEKIRDKSGRYAYILGILITSVSIMIFSILGQLELIPNPKIFIFYLFGYFILQLIAGQIIYRRLMKKY